MDALDGLYDAAIAGDADARAKLEMEADILNEDGETILHIESKNGNAECVRFILREFASKNLLVKLSKLKQTALHLAASFRRTEVADVLIDAARHLPPSSFQAFLRQGDEDLNTALHLAVRRGQHSETALKAVVRRGHVAIAKLLVEADPGDRHIQNHEGKTPIYIAAETGNTDIVKIISTTSTAPLNLDGPGGSTTALHAAIKNRSHDIELVEVLVSAARWHLSSSSSNDDKIDANDHSVTSFQAFLRQADEDLNTVLHIAIMQGNLATAKILVEADPTDPGIQNNKAQTPFYLAVQRRDADIVKMMCTTCTAPFYLTGPGGSTSALHAVIKNLDEGKNEVSDVIKMLIDILKRAIISENKDLDDYTIHRVFADSIFSETDEEDTRTLLELAVERNYLQVVELILDVQNPAYEDDWIGDDFISLMPLIYKARDRGYKNIVKLLTERYQAGAELSTHLKFQARLISAITKRKQESVFRLLDEHAHSLVTFADNLGWTALHHAIYHEFNSVIYAIIEAQKSFGHQFVYQDMVSTPFHVAAGKGCTSTIILLMQLWPSWSSAYTALDKDGQNILHLAAQQSKREMIQGILRYCPEMYKNQLVNQQDNNGNTPLHLLIKCGCFIPQVIRYKELDIKVENKEKWTSSDMLYFDDHIIGDQVQIKIALDDVQVDHKRDILSSLVLLSKRERKDVILKKQADLMIYEKHARMKEDTHAISNCFSDAIEGDAISKAALEMEADTLKEEGNTILHVESMRGVTERVRYILMEFAKENLLVKLDALRQTALHLAAQHEHTEVVEVLIDAAMRNLPSASANDDTQNPVNSFHAFVRQASGQMGNTALHIAVLNGNVAIVKLLLQADPNDSHVQNNEGKTPIYIAAENGYDDIVNEICMTCTSLSIDGPGGGTTALYALIHNLGQVTGGTSDVIRMMVNAARRWSSAEFEALFTETDELGSTVLQLAMERNYVDAVEVLLQEDPAYQHGRKIKRNGLMRLIYKAVDNRYSGDIIKLLSQTYEAGIDPDHRDVVGLILAMKRRDEDSVLGLLGDAKQLVTFTEDNGWTPLHYAVYHEFDSILGAIIEAQEEVGHPFVYANMVQTPFHVAVEYGYTSTLQLLMQLWPGFSSAFTAANSPYTAVDENDRNILHLAATDNRKEMVQGILKYCPERWKDMILKQQDTNGDTPLHLLISHGCFIPELIKHKGLETMTKNKYDFTPQDMLYFKNEIVGDQVHIKIALDRIQTNHQSAAWNLWAESTKKKTDLWKSIVPPSKRRIKDVIFDERKKLYMDAKHNQMYKRNLPRYQRRSNTQIIVTALITTVTFTAGFTMPGGLHQSGEVDEGLVVLTRKAAFTAFMVSDALALLLSTCSLFLYFLETMCEDYRQLSILNAASVGLNIVSVMAMMLTFITGTYLVLSNSPALAITICLIGSFFFVFVIVLLIMLVCDRKVKRNED